MFKLLACLFFAYFLIFSIYNRPILILIVKKMRKSLLPMILFSKKIQVQARAREIYSSRGYTDMKCSYGWFKRWSQRFHIQVTDQQFVLIDFFLLFFLRLLLTAQFNIQLRYSYDDELLEWILARFDANAAVTHHDLQNHGLSLVRKEDPHFKASSGWALRYVSINNFQEIPYQSIEQ